MGKTSKQGLTKVASRYAEALFEVVKSSKTDGQAVLEDLKAIKEIFESNDDLTMLVNHPDLKFEDKKSLIEKAFKGKVQEEVLNLLFVLLQRRRINIVTLLAEDFMRLHYKDQNLEFAVVNSANELSDKQLDDIKSKLEKIFDKKLELKPSIDESLVAGVKVNIGDKVIDFSVKSKLKQMKQLLTK